MSQHVSNSTSECATLVELLNGRAVQQPHQLAYTFLVDGENEAPLTYGELERFPIACTPYRTGAFRRIPAKASIPMCTSKRNLLILTDSLVTVGTRPGRPKPRDCVANFRDRQNR
jgi:hypothetical protein